MVTKQTGSVLTDCVCERERDTDINISMFFLKDVLWIEKDNLIFPLVLEICRLISFSIIKVSKNMKIWRMKKHLNMFQMKESAISPQICIISIIIIAIITIY